MADEREKAGQQVQVPNKYAWTKLVKLDGDDLELQYHYTCALATGCRCD